MFRNKTDRLNYGGLLIPPSGYELSRAVATTYSLDLETLTAATIALGVQENTDSVVAETPVAMLRTLQKVADKVVVFCEAGQTKIPNTQSPLILLLEKMIITVALPEINGTFPSFHPKTWTLEYENNDGNRLYRFIVLSRNLTFDRSWDVSFMMEGTQKTGDDSHVSPLMSFLTFLKKWTNSDRYANQNGIISQLIDNLNDVKFELNRKEFGDFKIMPLGIGNDDADMLNDDLFKGYPNVLAGVTFKELTIMSPFLSTDTIKYLNSDRFTLPAGTRRRLFTRRSELPKIKDVANNFDVYVLKDTIIDGEESLPEGEENHPQLQDIHAKMYLRYKYPNHHLYLGSMNASHSGISRNVEMMIKLEIKNQYINMDRLCADFFGGEEESKYNPFEKVDLSKIYEETADNKEEKELENILKSVCRIEARAEVQHDNEDYSVIIRFNEEYLPNGVTIHPLRALNQEKVLCKEIAFNHLNLLHLSEFYVVTVSVNGNSLSRVFKIPTDGIPEDRDKKIVQGIIHDKKTFMDYVAMALGDDLLELFGSSLEESHEENETGNSTDQYFIFTPLYERMLNVAYENKHRLLEIEPIMQIIDDEKIISEEFRDTYETFKSALKL